MEGNAIIEQYVGGYDDYMDQKNNKLNARNNKKTQPSNSKTRKTPQKLSYNQQQQLNSLPEKIENLENEILMAQKLLSDPTFYQNPDAQNLTIKLRETERQLEMLYDQWSKLDNGN
jgi:ATP-binding cassette subfamily F protein uup